jgi:2-polyprenyl-3-methyl-5-hydroxy-6-metoxy-1,4-benzoquinol methylase
MLSGIDNKSELITIAKEKATHEGVDNTEFSVGVAQKINFPDNFFDIVTCRLAFHHLPEPLTVLGEINRVLKPNGKFNLSDPILSEYAQAVWVPVNRLRESDFYCYHTYLALVQMLNQSGFKITSIRPFTFKRVLDKWVKDRDKLVPERIKEVVLELDERVLKELRFTKTSEEGWVWYYNCLDILAVKKSKSVD